MALKLKTKKILRKDTGDNIIEIKELTKEFIVNNQKIIALNNINLEIKKGELLIILGQSGAGKTTLLNMLGGMDTPTSGNIFVGGEDISTYNKKQLTIYRRNKIGFVFQFYNLMPNLTAIENIELATELNRKTSYKPLEVLTLVGLKHRADNFPAQLSGGEQQRVSIARAIAKNSDILLCDEPTGALDYQTGKEILTILKDFAKKNKSKTVIIVTHNSEIKDIADRIIHVKNGQITKIEVNDNPKDISEIKY